MSIFLKILAGAFKEAGTEAVVGLLQQLHDTKPKLYKRTLLGAKLLGDGLFELVDKTNTKIDDALVEGIVNAAEVSAKANGIDLSIFDDFINELDEKLA